MLVLIVRKNLSNQKVACLLAIKIMAFIHWNFRCRMMQSVMLLNVETIEKKAAW